MHELLTHEQEIELAKRIERGDQLARERLALANQGLVALYARRWTKSLGVTVEEAMQIANIGLMRAVDAYDWRKCVRFASYAGIWIKQALNEWRVFNTFQIRLPKDLHNLYPRVIAARDALRERGITPTAERVAAETGLQIAHVQRCIDYCHPSRMRYLNAIAPGNDIELGDLLPSNDDDVASLVERSLSYEELARALHVLDERSRCIIIQRYGLDGTEPRKLHELSAQLGVTRQRVAELEQRALAKLKEQLEAV